MNKQDPRSSSSPQTDRGQHRVTLECGCQELDDETRLRLITETIDQVFWLSTPGIGQMIYISPAYETIWGRSCDSLYEQPQSFMDAIHPDDVERIRASLAEHALEGWNHEYRIIDGQNRLRWIHDRGYPVYDRQGELSYLVGVASDITAYKEIEERLLRNQRSLADAQRIANLGNWDWDIVHNQLHWSDEIYRIFGLQPQQFAATYDAFLACIHPDDRDAVIAAVNDALNDQTEYTVDHRIVRPDGEQRIVREQGEVVFDAQGKPVYMVGTVHDITEIRQNEQALRRANRALRTLSGCNEVLVQSRNENELLKDVCRTIVEIGGYRMAWVGYLEQDAEQTIRPVAHAGYDQGYMEKLRISLSDQQRGRGPVGKAIREQRTQIIRDVQEDPAFLPWRDDAIERDYHSVLAIPLRLESDVMGCLTIYARERGAFDQEEIRLLEEMALDLSYGIRSLRIQQAHEQANERERKLLMDTIGAMALTIEKRDPYTAGHQSRVARLATAIAEEMGFDGYRVEGLRLAASVHDIGKIYVPAEILNRPGRLMPSEFEVIKTHVEVGYDILRQIDFPWPVADIVNQHHERLDGSGYPNGLTGDAILPEARILAVSDVVESIQSHRPYRAALGVDVALQEIQDKRGSHFDADVVDACLRLFREKGFTFE